jgi:hypothetical protein
VTEIDGVTCESFFLLLLKIQVHTIEQNSVCMSPVAAAENFLLVFSSVSELPHPRVRTAVGTKSNESRSSSGLLISVIDFKKYVTKRHQIRLLLDKFENELRVFAHDNLHKELQDHENIQSSSHLCVFLCPRYRTKSGAPPRVIMY